MFPRDFISDGCSSSPDSIFGYSVKWCCEIHDWRGCTRCHPPGRLTQKACNFAAKELGWHVRYALPFGLRWIGWAYHKVVYRMTETYWDSCGIIEGELSLDPCRHGILPPRWLIDLGASAADYYE